MPKIPGFGGEFKLELTKVLEANVIKEEDKAKVKNKELPTVSKTILLKLNQSLEEINQKD